MLETIHEENWKEAETQSRDGEKIPYAILELLTNNAQEFDAAYWKIENHVVVQGDLYSSAALVPKYLEEVYLKAKFKPGVQELLFQIGNGVSQNQELEHQCFNEVVAVFKRLIAHSEIQGTENEKALTEELAELQELHNERKHTQ